MQFKFDNKQPFYTAYIELYVINNKEAQDYFISDISFSEKYNNSVIEMISEDIPIFVQDSIIKEIYEKKY